MATTIPPDLTCREMVQGMPLAFDERAARGLRAVVQFRVAGREPGDYYLEIADGSCRFHEGVAHAPSVTIRTTSEVWLAICRGTLDGSWAYLTGRYRVEGNAWLLLRLKALFPAR